MDDNKDKWIKSDLMAPLIDLNNVSPYAVFNSNQFNEVLLKLTKYQQESIKSIFNVLNTLSMSSNTLFSLGNNVSPLLKNKNSKSLTLDTTRRRFELLSNLKLIEKLTVDTTDNRKRIIVYRLITPSLEKKNQLITHTIMKHSAQPSDIEEDSILSWAQANNLKVSDQKMLFGQKLLQIMAILLPKTKKKGVREHTERINMFGNYITATITTTSETLPLRSILKEYFHALECVKMSMKENLIRTGENVLTKQTYQLPLSRFLEVMGKQNQTLQRRSLVKVMKELSNISIQLEDLPFKDLQEESFISFSPISNLSYFVKRNIDSMRTTGNGAAVFVFSLPSFVVDSIAQQIQSEHHLINNYKMLSPNAEFPYSQHFVEQLYNLPAQWGVNNDFDDLVICLGIMISELEQDPKIRSISWQTAKNITKSELSTTRLKSSFFKLAEKKGAKKKWNSLILQSEQGMSVTFDDEGIKIE